MDATCFTQNPQKSQNLLDADFFTQNTQKSQNLPEAVIFTLNSQNTQNLPDANMGSLCASQNSADSACKKKRLFHRFQETLAFQFKNTRPVGFI